MTKRLILTAAGLAVLLTLALTFNTSAGSSAGVGATLGAAPSASWSPAAEAACIDCLERCAGLGYDNETCLDRICREECPEQIE